MGRSITPTYRFVVTTTMPVVMTPMAWRREYGKPTRANIDKWVTGFEESLKPGGCNAHLGIFSVVSVKIIHQKKNKVVAVWYRSAVRQNEPLFQVIA